MNEYTRGDAIHDIITALGDEADAHDIDAIADEAIGDYSDEYALIVDVEQFWDIVARHAYDTEPEQRATIDRAALNYFPAAVRAADAHPESTALWVEAARAQRAIITAADLDLVEPAAAKVQELVNTIARLAGKTSIEAITRAEDAKTRIIALTSN